MQTIPMTAISLFSGHIRNAQKEPLQLCHEAWQKVRTSQKKGTVLTFSGEQAGSTQSKGKFKGDKDESGWNMGQELRETKFKFKNVQDQGLELSKVWKSNLGFGAFWNDFPLGQTEAFQEYLGALGTITDPLGAEDTFPGSGSRKKGRLKLLGERMLAGWCYIYLCSSWELPRRERGFTSTAVTIWFGTFQKGSSLPNDQRLTEFWLNAHSHRLPILVHCLYSVCDLPSISIWISCHNIDNPSLIKHLQKKRDQVTRHRGAETYTSRVPMARVSMPGYDVCGVTCRIELGVGFECGSVTTNSMASGNLLELSKPPSLHLTMERSLPV